MKKGDVIQFAIIIMSLVIAINSLQYFFSGMIGIIYAIALGEFNMATSSLTIVSLLVTLLYAAICWQLLVKSRNIADYIYEKANLGTSFIIVSRPNDLLYVLFIVMAFYYLLQHIPALVKGVMGGFISKAGSRFIPDTYEPPTDWKTIIISLILPLILLIAGRPIANYFAQNLSDEPITIGEDIGNNENDITES